MIAAMVAAKTELWGKLLNAGNPKGMADMYTPDCKLLPPGGPPLSGREACQKLFEGYVAKGRTGAKLYVDEIQPGADDIAEGGTFWQTGSYKLFKEDGAIKEAGKYVAVFKKVPGDIQYDIDIWNSDGQ